MVVSKKLLANKIWNQMSLLEAGHHYFEMQWSIMNNLQLPQYGGDCLIDRWAAPAMILNTKWQQKGAACTRMFANEWLFLRFSTFH